MEKKIGKNISSGAEKVETIERENKYTQENVDGAAPKKKTVKTTQKTSMKTSAAPKAKKTQLQRAEKQERAAAEKRVNKAKAKAEKKEKKISSKAELKQKRLEKKAALKEKRLERKAMIARKKAERKQTRLEKKAALKEKRVERRAERVARREMLKNESKAERSKRLERQKRERIALKRQKRDARNKARENKLKAREAAHERKAADKKHRREQRTQRKENRRGFGGWLAAVISLGVACLALGAVVTAGAFRLNEMQMTAEGSARSTLYEMVSVSQDMENSLSKLRVSSGVDEQRNLLTDLLVDSALMESALERVPIDAATSTDISSFVNRTSSYARTLLSRLAAGKTLTETEKNTILYLYEINTKLYNELNTLATTMTEKELREFLGGKQGTMSEKFGQMGAGTREEPEEIVDAPFAGQGNVGENKLAAYDEITSSQAEERAKELFAGYHVKDIRYTGETNAADVSCYNFVMTDQNGVEIFAEITKNGGKLAFFDTYEECHTKNFDLEMCDKIAKDFLADLGIEDVEAVWLSDGGMVANLTYVGNRSGVRAYPEMIRVRVCEEKGRVVGIDARGYLLNREERSYHTGISESEAQSLLSDELNVTASNLAYIPLEGGGRLCYEFFCEYGEEEYVVYLDARTGAEVQVFHVRDSARGSYLE